MGSAVYYTTKQLWERGKEGIPEEFISASHLIYSSPATLSFNSPGAEGFGVKRAGLSVPGSVMLIVSPGCCGRNTSSISTMPGYENRFFYLTMNETDLITGRHLTRIPKAVCHIIDSLEEKPSVVMICITCVDALLGTDMERVCRKAEEVLHRERPGAAGVKVRPCYMYALTREGRKPPMVHVRQSIYSLLEPVRKRASSVNILGYFAPVSPESELFALLKQAGVRKVRQIGACEDYDSFMKMAEANFNLILNPEVRPAAEDLEKRLQIPSIELTRFYRIDRIAAQYDALAAVLGTKFDYEEERAKAQQSVDRFRNSYPDISFSVGEALNADPFEMALSLVTCGFCVREIFGTVTADSFRYLRHLAVISPGTKVYSNLSPSMMHYSPDVPMLQDKKLIALGRDAGWYHPDAPCLNWADDIQPFGFAAVRKLFDSLYETAQGNRKDLGNEGIRLGTGQDSVRTGCTGCGKADRHERTKGYRGVLTPFAPDQSGAVSVLYSLGGMTVICDAGGCTGNICGFDEPRWFSQPSAVFSAGLRDMDAILGRDRDLVRKVADAAKELDVNMAAVIGTPVPAVIGTDFAALSRMTQKATGLPVIGVACDGMNTYDRGVEKTYEALLEKFCREPSELPQRGDVVGIWGWNPMDAHGLYSLAQLRESISDGTAVIFGDGEDGLRAFENAASVRENLVVTVSGLKAARWLAERFGISYRCGNPAAREHARRILAGRATGAADVTGKRILVVHEQITANAVRDVLLEAGAAKVAAATYFDRSKALTREGDMAFCEESDLPGALKENAFDEVWADEAFRPLIPDESACTFTPLPHFAVSGTLKGTI